MAGSPPHTMTLAVTVRPATSILLFVTPVSRALTSALDNCVPPAGSSTGTGGVRPTAAASRNRDAAFLPLSPTPKMPRENPSAPADPLVREQLRRQLRGRLHPPRHTSSRELAQHRRQFPMRVEGSDPQGIGLPPTKS